MVNSCHLQTTPTCRMQVWLWQLYCSFELILWYNPLFFIPANWASFMTDFYTAAWWCLFLCSTSYWGQLVVEPYNNVRGIFCVCWNGIGYFIYFFLGILGTFFLGKVQYKHKLTFSERSDWGWKIVDWDECCFFMIQNDSWDLHLYN